MEPCVGTGSHQKKVQIKVLQFLCWGKGWRVAVFVFNWWRGEGRVCLCLSWQKDPCLQSQWTALQCTALHLNALSCNALYCNTIIELLWIYCKVRHDKKYIMHFKVMHWIVVHCTVIQSSVIYCTGIYFLEIDYLTLFNTI